MENNKSSDDKAIIISAAHYLNKFTFLEIGNLCRYFWRQSHIFKCKVLFWLVTECPFVTTNKTKTVHATITSDTKCVMSCF